MRCIDADALLDEVMDRHCNDCDRRKGIKNGKYRIIYSIGEAPCRACDVDDLKDEIEDAPTIEPERETGRWRHYEGCLTCSECGIEYYDDIMEYCGDDVPRFCPNCGARMEDEE